MPGPALDTTHVALLYASDDPEKLVDQGTLFSARLPSDGIAARIFFDHVNNSAAPLRVIAAIANVGADTGTIRFAGGDAGPAEPHIGDATNAMHVGHVATKKFLAARVSKPDIGVTETQIAPGTFVTLSSNVLRPPVPGAKDGECAAGVYDFVSVGSGPRTEYELRVMACDPSRDASVWDELGPATNAAPLYRSGVFDISAGAKEISIEVPGRARFGETRYPRAKPFDTSERDESKGEYGVIKTFSCRIAGPRRVRLEQDARGKYNATATYLIDGEILESQQFPPHRPERVTIFDVPARQTRVVKIVTMAEINSELPVELSIADDTTEITDARITRTRNPIV